MYWPVGPPRIFELQLPAGPIEISEDGVRDPSPRENDTDHTVEQETADGDDAPKHSDNQSHEQAAPNIDYTINDQRILSLQVSRNSHYFATCTTRSLTVWQTKVGT